MISSTKKTPLDTVQLSTLNSKKKKKKKILFNYNIHKQKQNSVLLGNFEKIICGWNNYFIYINLTETKNCCYRFVWKSYFSCENLHKWEMNIEYILQQVHVSFYLTLKCVFIKTSYIILASKHTHCACLEALQFFLSKN